MAQTVLCPGYIQKGASSVSKNDLTALTGYQPIKYIAESKYDGANKAFTDWILFRTAEVYLNYAEAKAELGTLTQDDLDVSINKIRDRAKMPHLSGCYFPSEGEYDMDNDGVNDLLLSTTDKGSFKGTSKKIGKDLELSNGTSGYIYPFKQITVTWDENRDYLWPIPASERVLTGGKLTQNPGWTDSTNFD